jgi:hypothetical protein
MLYLVSERHRAEQCPGKDPELLKVLASRISKASLSKKNVKLIDAFIDHSCMLQTGPDHLCVFIVEANSTPAILSEIFKPLEVEVRPAVRWQGYDSKVKQAKIV